MNRGRNGRAFIWSKDLQKMNFSKKILLCGLFLLAGLACDSSSLVSQVLTAVPLTPTPAFSTDATLAPLPKGAIQEIPMQVGYGARGSFYEVYFTDPFNPEAYRDEGGPDAPLVQAIDGARVSVDVAAYSLDLRSVRDALLRAQKRGIEVRMVMENTNLLDAAPQALLAAGIPIVGDDAASLPAATLEATPEATPEAASNGLMHDKFVVIDRSEVWTGSMNFTTSGAYEDNNNLVRIRSARAAEDYTVEFEEMFKRHFFGEDTIDRTPYHHLTVDGVPLEIYFSPDDHVASHILDLLRRAQHSIYFMAYSFTTVDFGDLLIQKARAGVDVSGVMEADQIKSNEGTRFTPFQDAHLPVYQDGNEGQMHHKVFILDEKIVITGSYNFSASAETTNDENVIIFFDPQIASQYLAEFKRVEAEAQK